MSGRRRRGRATGEAGRRAPAPLSRGPAPDATEVEGYPFCPRAQSQVSPRVWDVLGL